MLGTMVQEMTEWEAATLLRFSGWRCGPRPRVTFLSLLRRADGRTVWFAVRALVREARPAGERERAQFACLLRVLAQRHDRGMRIPRSLVAVPRRMREQCARTVSVPVRAGPGGMRSGTVRGRPPGQ